MSLRDWECIIGDKNRWRGRIVLLKNFGDTRDIYQSQRRICRCWIVMYFVYRLCVWTATLNPMSFNVVYSYYYSLFFIHNKLVFKIPVVSQSIRLADVRRVAA